MINELLCDPRGSDEAEFIELSNTGIGAVDLTGWKLGDSSTRLFTISKNDFTSTTILPGGLITVGKEVSGLTLNNTGDEVTLYFPDGGAAAAVSYDACREGKSYGLLDGTWQWSDEPTPAGANVMALNNQPPQAYFEASSEEAKVGEEVTFDASGTSDPDSSDLSYRWAYGDGEEATGREVAHRYREAGTFEVVLVASDGYGSESEYGATVTVSGYDYSDVVVINELLPACSGPDQDCEFIELFNSETRAVSLGGWSLTDTKSFYRFPESASIAAGGYLVVPRSESKITLNNDADTVYLVDPSEKIIHGVSYREVRDSFSFIRLGIADQWAWTEEPTAGAANVLVDESDGPELASPAAVPGAREDPLEQDPLDLSIVNITEQYLGKLIRVSGEVESVSGTGIYLVDELGNVIRVYIQKKTKIPKPDVESGETMTVTGILDKTEAGLRLLPRTAQDIAVAKAQTAPTGQVLGISESSDITAVPAEPEQPKVRSYLLAAGGVLLVLVIGLLAKYRWGKKNDSDGAAVEEL